MYLEEVITFQNTIETLIKYIHSRLILFDLNYPILGLLSLRLNREETLKYRCVCRPPAEKFHIVSNDHVRTHKCDFSVSNREYPFWGNLVQNIKIVSLS